MVKRIPPKSIHDAAIEGLEAMEKWVAEHPEQDIDAQDSDTWSALHIAADHNDVPLTQWLISHKANLNLLSLNQRIPLHIAVEYAFENICSDLIEAGACVNAEDLEGDHDKRVSNLSCLAADSYGENPTYLSIGQKLIGAGSRVNELNLDGQSPLHIAVKRGSLKWIDLLIKSGADLQFKNSKNQTPLEFYEALDLIDQKPKVGDYLKELELAQKERLELLETVEAAREHQASALRIEGLLQEDLRTAGAWRQKNGATRAKKRL